MTKPGLPSSIPSRFIQDTRVAAAVARSQRDASDPTLVNSSHHQCIQLPGDGLEIVAVSPDDGVIEALELAGSQQFVVGVQWHPERTYGTDALSRALFQAFVDAVRSWKLQPIQESIAPATGCAAR